MLAALLWTFAGWAAPQELSPDSTLEHDRARLRAHYARVEGELWAAQPDLDPYTMEARRRTIDALRDYYLRGEFGRLPEQGWDRNFIFVDDRGRRCAVAQLLHVWGEDELVASIAASRNDALVDELRSNPDLGDWLERVGLTIEEAARIQAPVTEIVDNPPPGGGWDGPPTAGPAQSPEAAGPRRGGPGATGGGTPGPSTTPGPGIPATPGSSSEDMRTHWWTWWDFNKLAWLVQERTVRSLRTDGEGTSAFRLDEDLRSATLPLLRELTGDPDARVRAAATIAYARLAGEAGIDDVLKGLDDASLDVRIAAILGLGAAGGGRADHALLRIAHWGGLEPDRVLAPSARFHAHMALALSVARNGGELGGIVLPKDDGALRSGEGTSLFQFLARSEHMAASIRELTRAFDAKGRPRRDLRDAAPRSLEALRFDDSAQVAPLLMRALGARNLDVRRSAAATLGTLPSGSIAPVLMTAFELEKESLTRGLILIAIGRQGGDAARDFLVESLRFGPKAARPWSALALGILAGNEDDAVARKALRRAHAKVKSEDERAAYLLAFGLGRDVDAAEILRHELRTSASELMRSNAALGLALTGAVSAAPLLREALAEETAPLARSVVAQALGIAGDAQDADALTGALHDVNDPALIVQHAAALAFHGEGETARSALESLRADGLSAGMKVGLVQALGMLLDESEPFLFSALSRDANFAVFPSWLNEPLRSTL